jgi:predicted Ser/Thr protein kinase
MAAGIQIGSTFAGYSIEGVLGRGGMGVVYVAEQPELGRKVAIKVIAPALASDPDYLRRFKHESRLAAAIEHPNAIPIYEAGVAEGEIPYLVMRYVDGVDLATLIRREGRLDGGRAVRIVEQVSGALDEAHGRGLVHRDVKPGNVIVERRRGSEQAYLTDFGLTKQMDATSGVTATGRWVGTIDYASPEQIKGKQVDARSDVYSLGCVMFVALTGQLPFEREADVAKLYAHINDPPPAPSTCAPGVTPELDPVVARALAKDPEERFPSAGDLGRAALAAASGSAIGEPERSVATGEAAPAPPQDTPPAPAESPPGTTVPATIPSDTPPPSTVAAEEARPPPPTRERAARGGRGRWIVGIAAAAVVAGLVVLGVTQLGGGGGGSGNGSEAEAAGIPFVPFTKAKAFTVDVPKGWESRQLERDNETSIKTKLVKPDNRGNVQIVQESTTQSPMERAQDALNMRQQEAGTTFTPLIDPPERRTIAGGRSAALLGYQWKEEPGMPPTKVSVFNYVFDDTGSGWRTRAAIAGTNAKSQRQAEAIATEMASTLQPK